MTEKNDPDLSREGCELFRDFEPEPPPQAWNAIRARLDDGSSGEGRRFFVWLAGFIPVGGPRLYPVLTAAGVVLVALFIWIGIRPDHNIRGRAWVDQDILDRGTAYLFLVHDRKAPFDSVGFYRKTGIDTTGLFHFDNVPAGSYLLRVHIHPRSAYSVTHNHGYYGDQLTWDSAKLIRVGEEPESCDIRVPAIKGK